MPRPTPRLRRTPRLLKPFLRPAAWRSLPRELTARRVGALARALPGGLSDPGFEVLLRRIDQAPVFPGQRVELFFEGESAFAAMRRAIDAAVSEVLLEAYILKDDATGRSVAGALAAAAGRGAAVRVLADAFGSSATREAFWDSLRERGVDVRLFHPLFSALWYQPIRDHRKILVVDRGVAFTGGMNVGDEYGSSRREVPPGTRGWRDTHARVEGSAAWELAVVFSEGWNRAGGRRFDIAPIPFDADARPPGARVLVLDSSPGRGHAESASALAALLAAARERFFLTNAYFAPRRHALEIFGEAAARGVDVRLLLPGLSDVPLVRHAGHGFFRELLRRGVRVFEYRASVLHAKTAVADGRVSLVGSSNMDFRSLHFNAECNLVLLDEETGRALERRFLEDLAESAEVTEPGWSRRPWPHRAGDALARRLSPLL
jgi:cardiolipin synthase